LACHSRLCPLTNEHSPSTGSVHPESTSRSAQSDRMAPWLHQSASISIHHHQRHSARFGVLVVHCHQWTAVQLASDSLSLICDFPFNLANLTLPQYLMVALCSLAHRASGPLQALAPMSRPAVLIPFVVHQWHTVPLTALPLSLTRFEQCSLDSMSF